MIGGGTRFGPYEVLSPLGAGGMGEVWRARDTRLSREVAVKVLPAELSSDPSRLKRFETEARSASSLNHPSIVTIYEIGQADSVSYIAMELVEGRTLRELVAGGPLPIRKLLQIGAQVADGLARAHEGGIVHRDLKPENVMVTKDGLAKILDFGLAKLTQAGPGSGGETNLPTQTATTPGVVMGTVGYMSPEQAGGQLIDFRSDQFSLGSVLYEMATGKKAFARGTAIQTLAAILQEEPEPVGAINPKVPVPLRWTIERCLAKDPGQRYASTEDLSRDLANIRDHLSEATLSGAATVAVTAPALRPFRFVVAGAVLAALAVGFFATRSLWSRTPPPPSFHRLTFRQGDIGNARFAPDGQTIVYGASWSGGRRRLYLTRSDSPESRLFDFPNADIFAISSSGEMAMLFDETFEGGVGVLARAPLAGGAAREVAEGIPYAGADWAPDGKDLVITRRVGDINRLEYPIGKAILESKEDDFYSPRFSPRGDQIAFYQGISKSLAVVDLSGKRKKTLSSGWGNSSGVPCWTPDGREIWITVGPVGQPHALYAVDLAGKRRLVMRVPGELELDDISRDGRVLATHHTMVWLVEGLASGETKERDLSWLDGSIPADLSADGKTLVFTETGEGSGERPSVYLRKTDGSPAVRLGEGTAIALSPDGRTVLALLRSTARTPDHLVLLPTGVGETRTLQNDRLENFRGGAWLPDGKRIVFAANEKGHQPRIYVQSAEAGLARPITPEGPWIRRATSPVSPDGKVIVGVGQGGKASLYPVEGGDVRAVAGLEAQDIPLQWSSDGRYLYVHNRAGNEVWLLDPASGSRRHWSEITPPEKSVGGGGAWDLLLTRDGNSYVYDVRRALSELYLVDGLK
jgi:Tol biopolymer transport system component